MVKKAGIFKICYKSSINNLQQIMTRHDLNLGISEKSIHEKFKVILQSVLNLLKKEQSQCNLLLNDNKMNSKSAWLKANILNNITSLPYTNNEENFKINTKSKQIQRVMSDDDIECVYNIWNRFIIIHQCKIINLLSEQRENESNIYGILFQNDINYAIQISINNLNNSDTIIKQLFNTLNEKQIEKLIRAIGSTVYLFNGNNNNDFK